ncbi:hypothetical protein Tco_0418721 [Tanacetum coccineum]
MKYLSEPQTSDVNPSPAQTSKEIVRSFISSDKSISMELKGDILSKVKLNLIIKHQDMTENVALKQRLTKKSFLKETKVHKEFVSKHGGSLLNGKSSFKVISLFDEIPEDTVDHRKQKNAQDGGGQEKW